jgi:pyruvate, water dikinase
MSIDPQLSTGLGGLDRLLTGLIPGDNIVWQVGEVSHYATFAQSFWAGNSSGEVHYFRFSKHPPLLTAAAGLRIHQLDPEAGFERFIADVHAIVQAAGSDACHVFDCLSGLAADWYSDTMLGNFFRLTCPFVYDMGSLAYFAILRNTHSFRALEPIMVTAQIVLDAYLYQDSHYIHPLKVYQRHSPTMHLLHLQEGEQFLPVTQSAIVSEVLNTSDDSWLTPIEDRIDIWQRTFLQAEELFQAHRQGACSDKRADAVFERLLRMTVARDGRMLELARQYMTYEDVIGIGKRLLGSGLIGGKSVGMLLARAILRQASVEWEQRLETHDSFYVGSDVFYTFLVENNIWWVRQKQRNSATFLEDAELVRERILTGHFPDHIQAQFGRVLDYFGQSPFIVRSSSLLEDNFGNAFSGKYESAFCVNQGERKQRLADFMAAVRLIYASTMSEPALRYRAQRGLLAHDEQMALLVQRVSGSINGKFFYPHIAGVGLSYNPYVWNEAIDPQAGLLRLVFGLGTRAVDRADDDYTRIVALNVPEKRPEANLDEVRRYAQRKADVLDLEANELLTFTFEQVVGESPDLSLDLFSSRDSALERRARERGLKPSFSRVLTFGRLFKDTAFTTDMRRMLSTLQTAYQYPVDLEFTANFLGAGEYKIDVVQCRPLQVREGEPLSLPPADIAREDLVLEAHGAVIGQSRRSALDRLIYVVPETYGQLTLQDRYAVARLIGELTHLEEPDPPATLALLGPGRWGTSTPSLGIPVSFGEIDTVSILCEIVEMRDDLIPDVSLGTHFFNDLIEADMLYLAFFPGREDSYLDRNFFENEPNRLSLLLPKAAAWEHVIRVIDAADLADRGMLKVHADALEQCVLCYRDHNSASA